MNKKPDIILLECNLIRYFMVNSCRWKRVGQIVDLNCYPLKSCGPIKRNSFDCHVLGFEYEGIFDRCFVVSQNNRQLTARTYPKMVLIEPKVVGNELILSAPDKGDFILNLADLKDKPTTGKVECWYSKVGGVDAGDEVAEWLSEYIVGKNGVLRLIFYPHLYSTRGKSKEDKIYKAFKNEDAGSYHDNTSYMLINQGSIDELNTHLDHVVKPQQFRPNLIVKGPAAYDEDNWKWIRIGENAIFRGVRPCQRLVLF